jgi:hypothetical protein
MAARSQTSKHYSQAEKRRNYSAVRCLPCSWCRMGCVVRCPTPWNHAHQPDPREGPAPPEDLEIPSVLPRYPASPSEVSASLPPQPLAPAMNHGRLVSGQRALRWLHVRAIPIGQGLVALSSAEPSFTRHRCPLRSKVSNCEKHKRRKRFTRAVLHAVDSSSSPPGALRPAYLPSIQKRVEASGIVCSATILNTNSTSNTAEVGDELAAQWTALASVDQVFKGAVSSQIIQFDYYRLVPRSADHFGPHRVQTMNGRRGVAT